MFAYCNNNPVIFTDSEGLRPVVGTSIEHETAEERKLSCEYMKEMAKHNDPPDSPEPPNSISDKGVEFICEYEGFSSEPYFDAYGYLTIGYGHLINDDESFTYITKEEAFALMKSDLSIAQGDVCQYMEANKVQFTQQQFDALVSVAYNSGCNGLKNVADRLTGGYTPIQAFTWLYTQEGARTGDPVKLHLWQRRMDECDIYLYGQYRRDYRTP